MKIQTAIAFYGFICNPIWALIKVQFSVSQSTEIYNIKIYESKSNACIQMKNSDTRLLNVNRYIANGQYNEENSNNWRLPSTLRN